jgi:GH18 family chitinase
VTSSVSARTSFINNLVNLMKSAGAVGLDIDWEVRAGPGQQGYFLHEEQPGSMPFIRGY